MSEKTSAYYNENAMEYAESTKNLEMEHLYDIYLKDFPAKGKILDVGCGSGRDSLNFKNKGYAVTAIDASPELAMLASMHINQEVLCKKAQDINYKKEFDGVWCMASLLHLKPQDLKKALVKISDSLKDNGKFYASFKIGEGQEVDNKGRYFNYMTPEKFKKITEELDIFKDVKFVETSDKLGRADTVWMNIIAHKNAPKLENVEEVKRDRKTGYRP